MTDWAHISRESKTNEMNDRCFRHTPKNRMFTKEGSKVPNAALDANDGSELDRLVDQPRLEQPGCLHANLDLFKWAIKLFPLISSSIIGDALEVALEARTLDVAASPYDAGIYTGGWKVKVEEEEGRREYKTRQIEIMGKSGEVRDRLIQAYEDVLL